MGIEATIGFIPKCPRKEIGCNGTMSRISGEDKAYKCSKCGAEIWMISGLTFREINDGLHCSTREIMKTGYVPNKKGHGSRNGRRRKKKRPLQKNYYFETRCRNTKQ